MGSDLPTDVPSLLDFLWGPEHGTGTRDRNRRNLRKNGGRLTGAPCGEEPPRVRKSRQSLAGVAGSVHHRPDAGLCPLTGGGEKGKTVLGGEKRGTQEGNIFLGQQWRRVPGSVDRGGHGVDTRPWAADPWAEVGEQQAAAQKTAGDRRPLPVDRAPGLKEKTLILLDVSTKNPVRTVNENFLSLQLDPSIIHDGWLDFLSSKRLVTLARGLSPAFLRFGGKRTDFLQFQNLRNPAKSRGGPGPDYYLKNYEDDIVRSDVALDKQKGCKIAQHPDVMLELQREKAAQMHLVLLKEQFSNTYSNLVLTARSLDKLYNFADCSGLHLIFALNALRRNPNNSWNSSSALSLLKYSASKKYNISWELGNEPNNYRTMRGRAVNGSQLGKDYIQLKSLLQPIRIYSRASLYGPNIGRPRKNVITLLDGFMKVAGNTVDAVTWQHCYIDGRVVKVMDFLKTRLLDTLSDQIRKIQKVVNTYTPGKKIWLEGVVTTSVGGTNNLSDSYAAGFLWLNTLGMLANRGIDVVIRHSFFDHGYNHLVDQNFNPLPNGM
ncbi:inactive heparanase-2 isoform X2 [Orcinus orca]|uniref:inactive heparanase-2 isoform X2 n=1 Tax=Orcinus orca TaxID=9733 RepID=UPI0021135015|nr:inactive heparanase-2 isoform X2 [Orcinus orca]